MINAKSYVDSEKPIIISENIHADSQDIKNLLRELYRTAEKLHLDNDEKISKSGFAIINDLEMFRQCIDDFCDSYDAVIESTEFWSDNAIAFAELLDNLCYTFVITKEKYDECAKWCRKNLQGEFSYRILDDQNSIFVLLLESDAIAFKIQWSQ